MTVAMLLAEVGRTLMCLILYISDISGHATSICALKGSSVDLPCSAPDSTKKWYTVHWHDYEVVQNEVSPDGHHVLYNMSEESRPTLTINDLRESDENIYCCRETTDNPELCWSGGTELHVADLQVKVIPATEGQTDVTLMCSTSCRLTEKPAAYMWYKNREFLYEDWSPWYQELVSSEEAVRYSCAIKAYKDLRAPEVSVDSVTPACFSVTYAEGRMCSYKQRSVDEPCSITYPREVHVQRTPADGYVAMTCTTSCPLTDPHTAYRWYQNGLLYRYSESQQFESSHSSPKRLSCGVKGHEDLLSAEVYTKEENGWTVNYVSRRMCSLEGSSVNITSEYLHPGNQQPKIKFWYKMKRGGDEDAENVTEAAGRVEYHDNMKTRHILTIKKLRKTDSAEYAFRLQRDEGRQKPSDLPAVALTVTGLKVKITPSAEVTEGQRVTLTCSTSCPLTDNTNYVWYLNSQPLTQPQNKHLVLDPVGRHHTGNYSCAVKTSKHKSSCGTILAVQARGRMMVITNAVRLAVALLIPILLPLFCLWLRKKKTSTTEPND